MDEDYNANPDQHQENNNAPTPDSGGNSNQGTQKINKYEMDDKGRIHANSGGAAAISSNSRTFIVLGWISAALTLLVSPFFAIIGIVFGILGNRRERTSGNVIIIVNAALAIISLLFNVFLM